MLANTISAHLSAAGHLVHTFTEAVSAASFFEAHHATVSLVILDMIMPGMDGAALYRKMKSIRPSIPVVVISGFSLSEDYRDLFGDHKVELLHKPFLRADLLGAVARALAH